MCWNWCSSRLETGVSGNLWSCIKEIKPHVLYDVECRMALEPMQGSRASSWVDLGYAKLFRIPAVTSVSFSNCDSFLGDALEFHQASQGALRVWWETRNCSAHNAGEWGLISWRGKSHGFSQVEVGTSGIFSIYGGDGHVNSCLFNDVRTPV